MARRSAVDLQKAKEARQKKVLIALLPVFLALMAWQGPKMYKAFFKSAETTPAAATATTTTPTATTPTATTGAVPTAPADGLPDTEPLPAAGSDQLLSFSRFSTRDPFVRPGGTPPDEASSGGSGTGTTATATSAVIDVNGSSETVAVGGSFPAGSPVFVLVSLDSGTAQVGLTTGSFEGGEDTVDIGVGEAVELVGDDGSSYTVTLVSVS